MTSISFNVGGLSASLEGVEPSWPFYEKDPTPRFLTNDAPELRLAVRPTPPSDLPHETSPVKLNDARTVQRSGDGLEIQTHLSNGIPARVIRISNDWRSGEILLNSAHPAALRVFPLEPPTGEMLYQHWAVWKEGAVLHAATLLMDGMAVVAMGHSGYGKSTLSRLWADAYGPDQILTDERTLIRRMPDGKIWAHGTPWQGSGAFSKQAGAPIRAFIRLKKSTQPTCRKESAATLGAELVAHTLLPTSDRPTIDRAFDVCTAISKEYPFFEFGFRIDPSEPKRLLEVLRQLG